MRHIIPLIKSSIYNLQVGSKLKWIYFILIVLPLGCFSIFAFGMVRDTVSTQTLNAASQAFESTVMIVNENLIKLKTVLEIITHDRFIYQVSSTNPDDYEILQQLQDSRQILSTFKNLTAMSQVDSIRLYVNNAFIYSSENNNIFIFSNIQSQNWVKPMQKTRGTTFWCSPSDYLDLPLEHQNNISAARFIYDPINISQPLALVRVDIRVDSLKQIINNTPITPNGSVFLTGKNGTILSSTVGDMDHDVAGINLSELIPDKWNPIELNRKPFFVNYSILSETDWNMISIISYEDVFGTSKKLRAQMLFMMAFISVISYTLAYSISNSSIKRLSQLTRTMKKVEQGDINATLKAVGGDEIGQLMNSFNSMMGKINTLMDDKIAYGKEIKNLELKALQAQINPHFLYNSLDLVNCIAIKNNEPEIRNMVNALARFYKISLNRGRDVISISEELEHVKLYVKIQNMRFENSVKLSIEADESILSCQIIKIILQPIVENAIIHGIFEKESKAGNLKITVNPENDDILFVIEDDGIGMEQDVIQSNFESPLLNPGQGGYGINNINCRIKIAYGEAYGLSCTSLPGIATRVQLRIPRIYETKN